jgi:4-nitrophenyl phosphatase
MKRFKGYLIDLDGTMYRGTEVIAEARDFVKRLISANIPYLYVTNNSTKTPEAVAQKLREFDIPAKKEDVFTSAMAAANYIRDENNSAKVFMIGEEGLKTALLNQHLHLVKEEEAVDYVVIGMDQQINYEKLAAACLAVRKGASYIITNGDTALPTERGLLPGNGALSSVVTVSTQTKPLVIGKPGSIIVNQAIKLLGIDKKDVAMVGDNYYTDILAGIHAGIETILVHTGVTTKEELMAIEESPSFTVDSLSDWKVIK